MTAISIPAAGTTRMRLTTRGRRVVAALAALPAVAAVMIAVVSGGAALASSDIDAPTSSFSTVTVSYGDTLWSIAERVAPGEDPRDVVDAFARLNALPGGTLSIGQELAVPAEYTAAH